MDYSRKPSIRVKESVNLEADPKTKRPAKTLCLFCFDHWDANMARHATRCTKRDMTKSADELKKLGADNKDKFNSAVSTMRGSLFFSLDELQPTYTANEVVQLLMDFGQCPIPKQFQDVYVRKTNTRELAERYQALGRTQKEEPTRRQEARPVEVKQTTSTPSLPHIPDDVQVAGPSGCDDDDDFGGPFQELESSPEINQTQRKGRKRIGSFISDDDDDTDTEGPTDKTKQKRKPASVRGKQLIKGPTPAKKSKAVLPDMDKESDDDEPCATGLRPLSRPTQLQSSALDSSRRALDFARQLPIADDNSDASSDESDDNDDENDSDNDDEQNASKGGKTIDTEISADSDGFVREYSWKTGPKRILSEMGWYRIPVTFYNDSIFKDLREYYENRGIRSESVGTT